MSKEPEEEKPKEEPKINPAAGYNRTAILLVATVPATAAALLALLTNAKAIPIWLEAGALTLIISVESLICFFSYELATAAKEAESSYDELLKMAEDVKKPLKDLGDALYEMKDLLPTIAAIVKAVPKDRIKETLDMVLQQVQTNQEVDTELLRETWKSGFGEMKK